VFLPWFVCGTLQPFSFNFSGGRPRGASGRILQIFLLCKVLGGELLLTRRPNRNRNFDVVGGRSSYSDHASISTRLLALKACPGIGRTLGLHYLLMFSVDLLLTYFLLTVFVDVGRVQQLFVCCWAGYGCRKCLDFSRHCNILRPICEVA